MSFYKVLSNWYSHNQRNLPWRDTRDPYKIWLSEIILQQTRVNQGLPYYQKFVEQYPTVFDLASAPLQEVLRTWQGLGYYSRARNLHKCAQNIVELYHGNFPNSFEELQNLPGIGKYTAAAIASFAFDVKVPVVDGNVIRFISRYKGIEDDVSKASTVKAIFNTTKELMIDADPATFNQAIMEFGSIQCTPRNPSCNSCGFKQSCIAFSNDLIETVPFKPKKNKSRERYFTYLVVENQGSLLLEERKGKDIWKGLYQFPLIENKRGFVDFSRLDEPLISGLVSKGYTLMEESSITKHLLSHQTIYARFLHFVSETLQVNDSDGEKGFYSKDEILALPKPVLITRYLEGSFYNS